MSQKPAIGDGHESPYDRQVLVCKRRCRALYVRAFKSSGKAMDIVILVTMAHPDNFETSYAEFLHPISNTMFHQHWIK